ncbi:vWA domain-containing protein [Microbacterium sp.]|uniref:vWA domain-containing protein n=1 Tax=Microbacterium sp. TaxID=51671 RepID=UPI003A879C03
MTDAAISLLEEDWLADELWEQHGADLAQAVAGLVGLEAAEVAAVARDVFALLLLAGPRIDPYGREHAPRRSRVLERFIEDRRTRALRSLTVGDEHACRQWTPAVAASVLPLFADVPEREAVRAPDDSDAEGAAEGAFSSFCLGEGQDRPAPDDAATTATKRSHGREELFAALIDADGVDGLRRLVATCRHGLAAHNGLTTPDRRARVEKDRTRDLARVEADVWSALADPSSEALLWDAWNRGGLRARERKRTPAAPLIIAVDESGSMQLLLDGQHTRRTWSMATVLACTEVAHADGADLIYIGFGGTGQAWTRTVPATDRHGARRALIDILSHYYGGGTSLETPVTELIRLLSLPATAGGRALIVSDGEGVFDTPALATALRVAAERARVGCWGIRIGGDAETPLHDLCDSVARLEDFAQLSLTERFPTLTSGAGAASRLSR